MVDRLPSVDETWNFENEVRQRQALNTNDTATVEGAAVRDASRTAVADQFANPATVIGGTVQTLYGAQMLAKAYGVVGNGVTDDSTAFTALLGSAVTFGARVMLSPGQVVRLVTGVTVPSGTRLDGNGATIKSAVPGAAGRPLILTNQSDIVIENLTIDGDKASYAPATEQRHNIFLSNSDRITFRNVRSINAKGDGIYVGGTVTDYCTDIALDHVVCDGNHRNGLSVISVIGFTAIASRFINTVGTNPQNGVDLEPNTADAPLERIKFIGCDMTGNAMQGVSVAAWAARTIRQGDVDFIGCTIDSNTQDGVKLVTGDGIRFIGGSISKNGAKGVWFSAASGQTTDVLFDSVKITENVGKGVLADAVITGLTFNACRVYGNTTGGTSIGMDINPVSASVGLKVIGCDLGGASQTHGIRTGANVSKVTLIGNNYPDVATATSLGDDVATRIVVGSDAISLPGASITRSATASAGAGFRNLTDTVDKVLIRSDGTVSFSSGTVAADATLFRASAGVVAVGLTNAFRTGRNVTASRPTAAAAGQGGQFYDTTLGKPIWSDGTNWKDAAGTTV